MFTATDREECLQLLEKYYRGQQFHDAIYQTRIRKYLRRGQRVLDAGCGRYMRFCKEFSNTAEMVGIDIETTLETTNQGYPFAVRGDLSRLPFASNQFDMVISRSVVEHLREPLTVFREFWRVLRPGGTVILITPNKYDYVSIVASLTPYWLHQRLVSRIFQVPADDIFPTFYRANTVATIRKTLTAAKFFQRELDTINQYPAYLMFSPVLFRLGVLYERITRLNMFRCLRGSIICVFEKQNIAPSLSRAKQENT